MKSSYFISALKALIFLLYCGCATESPFKTEWIPVSNAERDNRCVALTREMADSFSFENPVIRKLQHGRMRLNTELRNREDKDMQVEVSTVFRLGGVIVDESFWRRISFSPNQTIAYDVSSLTEADSYSVRLRAPGR